LISERWHSCQQPYALIHQPNDILARPLDTKLAGSVG
jgi:hypothetical protein